MRVTDRYYGTLAHKIFLHTLKATMHVYAHVWGPKTTCHDALEQVCVGGRVRRGPRRAYGRPSRRRSFGEKKKKKKKNVCNSNAAGHPFCALPRGILRGNGHMWAPPLYHFVWDFSLFYEYTLILKGGATSLELVYYISVLYFANLCTS